MLTATPAQGALPPRPKGSASRAGLLVAVLVACGLALLPLLTLLVDALIGSSHTPLALGFDGASQVRGTLLLVGGEGVLGGVLGTSIGWLTAVCRFPGRRWLRIAQLVPMAFPAYLLAASLIDWGSHRGLRIHGLGWAVLLLTLANYSYVFLLSTESFSVSGRRLLEASRSLGVGPWRSFFRVALPIALPSIGAGIALSAMEVVNELGAVRLLGVPSLSAGILDRWQVDGDPQGAALLSLVALAIVAVLITTERLLRQRSRRWNLDGSRGGEHVWPLSGWRAALAQLLCAAPPCCAVVIPALWIQQSWQGMQAESFTESFTELAQLASRSLGLALVATTMTCLGALLLAICRRWSPQPLVQQLSFLAGMGYAIPGSVLALGLILLGGPLGFSPLVLLLWGYGDRFMAVSKQGLDAGLERIPPSIDETATSLGCDWRGVLRRIHLPLLKGPLLVGALLVVVDVIKELPITLALRPFDFDTLAVRVFQYASDERVGAAIAPALLIMGFGLIASLALVPTLEQGD